MNYSVETIREIVKRDPSREIIYFWGHTPTPGKIGKPCFSQWYDCYFIVDGVSYHTTEQYMMACKARLFGDEDTLSKIMQTNNPADHKKLGRQVSGFDPVVWDAHKYNIVVEGNKAKFSQNAELKEFLLSTGDAIIVEASPYDRIWGIGRDLTTAKSGGIEQWRGENLLGCALMQVRDYLRETENTNN